MGVIVIESGGTNSTWWYESPNGEVKQFQDIGFPPFAMTEQRAKRLSELLRLPELNTNHKVYFFGASCEHQQGKEIIARFFKEHGFNHVEVHSDLLGACIACHGNNSGVTAIIGTGSVAAVYNGENITEQHGGLGYLLGDEGSGFYLGRLLLKKYFTGELDPEINRAIETYFNGRDTIIPSVYSENGRMKIAGLSKIFGTYQSDPVIEQLIIANFESFITTSLSPINNLTKISFIGSIAYYFQTQLEQALKRHNIELTACHQAAHQLIFERLRKKK